VFDGISAPQANQSTGQRAGGFFVHVDIDFAGLAVLRYRGHRSQQRRSQRQQLRESSHPRVQQ